MYLNGLSFTIDGCGEFFGFSSILAETETGYKVCLRQSEKARARGHHATNTVQFCVIVQFRLTAENGASSKTRG